MSKKASFSFDGLVDAEAEPTPSPGVVQRGAEPPAAEAKRPVGRPKIPPREDAKRIAVTVDGETYRRVAHACIDLGIDRQTFLERAVALMLRGTEG